ncbi:MAG: hypothetical protein K2X08_01650 [Chlamydiales bacterium]|nr:hypothetical protein [Chlamydiales bacterium]
MSSEVNSLGLSFNRYGGTQAEYLKRSSKTVQQGLIEVSEARGQGKDLTQLFFSLMNSLAKARNEIAEACGTEDSLLFGRHRMHVTEDVNHTCLGGGEQYNEGLHYKPYNQKTLSFLQEIIKGKIPLKNYPKETKFQIFNEYEGRKCSFELELITEQGVHAKQWDKEVHNEFIKTVKRLKIDPIPNLNRMDEKDFPSTKSDEALLGKFHKSMQSIKKASPEIYIHPKMNFILNKINEFFPPSLDGVSSNAKKIYLLGKVRIEMDGKMYALSQYIAWTYQDGKIDPVARLNRFSVVILHQDRYLIEPTLKEISEIFKTALQWESSSGNLKELKTQVALIRYLFAHAMPYVRGSAAIGEWIEEIIYRDRGLSFRRIEGQSADLEAFAAPLWSTYLDRYNATVEVSQK